MMSQNRESLCIGAVADVVNSCSDVGVGSSAVCGTDTSSDRSAESSNPSVSVDILCWMGRGRKGENFGKILAAL